MDEHTLSLLRDECVRRGYRFEIAELADVFEVRMVRADGSVAMSARADKSNAAARRFAEAWRTDVHGSH